MIEEDSLSCDEALEHTFLKTPLGVLKISGTANGLRSIIIREEEEAVSDKPPGFLKAAVEQLTAYFSGELTSFNLDLDPIGTDFQKEVWSVLQEIPYGKTWSYFELAKHIGDTKAVRAVASANGKNPLWIIIPCHRVIGSDGSLTGYAGGLWRKRWLLDHENPNKQQSLF